MKFRKLAQIFSEIETTAGRLQMTEQLASLFEQVTAHEAKIVAYLVMGELNAQYVGTKFNLAEKALIKTVANLLNQTDAHVTSELKKIGDLGSLVAHYEWKKSEDYTILEVYEYLQKIENIAGTGSQETKQKELCNLLRKLDSLSAKYVLRIVLGTLRLGFSQMTVIDALSWMLVGDKSGHAEIEHAYNRSEEHT